MYILSLRPCMRDSVALLVYYELCKYGHDQASNRSKSSCDGCWVAKSWITCVNTNGNTTLSEGHGVSFRITSDVRVRTVYHDLYLGEKALAERENVVDLALETIRRSYSVFKEKIPFELEGETFEPERGYIIKHCQLNVIMKDSITTQTCELSQEEFNDFLALYPVPSEYHVILPKSNQTVFDAPPGIFLAGKWLTFAKRSEKHILNLLPKVITRIEEMAFRNFIYTEDDEDLAFLPKEPSPGFGIGSPFVLVNMEPPKANEEPEIQPAEVTADFGGSPKPELFVVHLGTVAARIKDRKCKTKGGSSRPPVKRKLASRSSTSRATHAKTSSSKDVAPFLTVSDNDEGILLFFFLPPIDATVCHLKISAITPLAYKNHLDNHMDLELVDLHYRCYARHSVVYNAVKRRSCELLLVIEKLRGECDVMRSMERAREEEYEGMWVKCEAAMTEFEKNPAVWAGYQQNLLTLESKVTSLEAKKERLEAVEVSLRKEVVELKQDRRKVVSKVVLYAAMELVHSDAMGSLVGKLVSSAIVYGRCRAFEQVADMKEPFDLSKVKGYRSSYKKD
ncbi:hypothetical protein Tco_1418228 [Tanacetum coccineum]